jgi:HAD superfamily hydrolase (TIGR01509 family)
VQTVENDILKHFGNKGMPDFFHKAYYSNQMGHRKPDKEIYELLLQRENLNPHETFFVDDKIENIETAKRLGFQAWHLADREKLFDLLQGLKII